MMAAAKRAIPWLHGFLAYLAWRLGGMVWRRALPRSRGSVGERLCVIQLNAIGDVLMVTPLLQALVQALGPGRVDAVVSRRTADLLEVMPGLGEILMLDGPLRWRHPRSVLQYLRLVRRLRARRYDAILDASRLMQSAWLTFLARPGRSIGLRIPRRLGPCRVSGLGYLYTDEVDAPSDGHMIRQNLGLLAPLGIRPRSDRMYVVPRAMDREAAGGWLAERGLAAGGSFVVIHPGAKWPPKRWSAERYRLLTARLQAQGLPVVLAGDAADRGLLEEIAIRVEPAPHVLAGNLGLPALAALIGQARLFVGNDSGLSHLAVAVGTPAVVIFGPTLPSRTGPLCVPHRSLVEPIDCRPCRPYFSRERCERGHNYCMDLIDVDGVADAAMWLLGQKLTDTHGR